MIYELTFKTPDVLEQFDSIECTHEQERATELAKKYLKYGECVTLLVDTDKQTVTVEEVS